MLVYVYQVHGARNRTEVLKVAHDVLSPVGRDPRGAYRMRDIGSRATWLNFYFIIWDFLMKTKLDGLPAVRSKLYGSMLFVSFSSAHVTRYPPFASDVERVSLATHHKHVTEIARKLCTKSNLLCIVCMFEL